MDTKPSQLGEALKEKLVHASSKASSALDTAMAHTQSWKEWWDSGEVHEHLSTLSTKASCHTETLGQNIKQASSHPYFKEISYGILLSMVAILALAKFLRSRRRFFRRPSVPSTPQLEKAPEKLRSVLKGPDRKPGEWKPYPFTRPTPPPYPSWSLSHTKPLPYRPFRYGPKNHVTMGLRTMSWDSWIELDSHYPLFHASKATRILERGSKCCHTDPSAMDGAIELLEELCSYLPARYPTMFASTPTGLKNLWSGETFNITERPLAEDPMQMCARLIQDDLAIMFERPDGQYYLLAGAILLAGFWRLEDKLGMPLSEIHTSGDVPQFKSKLEKGMMNFFKRIKPEDPVLRNNYFLQVDDNLAWSSSIGSEDSDGISWSTAEKNRAIEHHFFRSERQSLRRLPRSGGVVFTIRTYFHPITEIAEEDYVPGRLASAVRSWGDDVARYKGKEKYGEVLLEYLDAKHKEQVERGLDMSEGRSEEGYPY